MDSPRVASSLPVPGSVMRANMSNLSEKERMCSYLASLGSSSLANTSGGCGYSIREKGTHICTCTYPVLNAWGAVVVVPLLSGKTPIAPPASAGAKGGGRGAGWASGFGLRFGLGLGLGTGYVKK